MLLLVILRNKKKSFPNIYTCHNSEYSATSSVFSTVRNRCLKSLKLVRTKDKEVPHILCCRYVLPKLEYGEMFTEKIVLSEKVPSRPFGNVIRHNIRVLESNKLHSDTERTHKGQLHVTCVLCSAHQVLLGFLFDEYIFLVHYAYTRWKNLSYR